jgi:HlyD family secretion protein
MLRSAPPPAGSISPRFSTPTIGWLACLFLLLCVGCGRADQAATKQAIPNLTPVRAVVVTETDLERTTTQPATLHAYQRAEIRAMVTGYVTEQLAEIGDLVEAGTTLAIIAVPEWEKRRATRESQILRRQAEQRRAEAGIALADAELQSARAKRNQAESQLGRSEAALAAAQAEFERTSDLVQRQSLQSRVLDEVRMRRDGEQAQLEALTSAIRAAEAEVGVAEAKRKAATADVETAAADTEIATNELAELDAMLAYTNLRAPFRGLVTARNLEPGDLVRASGDGTSQPPLFVVSQTDRLRARIAIPEPDAAYLGRDDTVTLTFPFFADAPPLTATVSRDAGSLDPSTRSLLVEVDLDNPDQKLLPGMFGQATIRFGTPTAAGTLPARAVRFSDAGDAYVYLIDNDSTISVTDVEIGLDDGKNLQVLTGLTPGQRVVDAHLRRFRDGERVEVLDR